MNLDKLEERTAGILGQIQASVAEYVRTMNEAGALRRRETDEAHRQQDIALQTLKALEMHGRSILETHAALSARIGNEWLGLVERGLKDIAVAQAREAATATTTALEARTAQLVASVERVVKLAVQIVEKNERICRSTAWKAFGVAGIWLLALAVGMRLICN